MKIQEMSSAVVGLILIGAMLLGGCGLIPGYDPSQAQAIAEKRQAELEPLADRLAGIEAAVVEARDAYAEAERKGDAKAIQEAGQVLLARLAEQDFAKEDWDNAVTAYKGAVQDFKDAKGAGGYLNVIVGTLGGILSMFGIGAPMIRRRDEALSVTSSNIDNVLEPGSLEVFKARQRETLSTGAKKILSKARGK